MGTTQWPCPVCLAEMSPIGQAGLCGAWNPMGKRILSATRTTFVFADTGRGVPRGT